MSSILASIFPKRAKSTDLEIRFHKEANHFGEHGQLNVSHVKQGLKGVPVRFVFVGVSEAPKMDLALFTYIWEEAKYQGYIPHHLVSYGVENEQVVGTPAELTLDQRASVGVE
jgi:hypothetical protein